MSKLKFQRTSFLENIEVELVVDHGSWTRPDAHLHGPGPRKERVRFDVTLSWRSPEVIRSEDKIEDVVNYAHVYRYIVSLAGTTQSGPLEALLDRICEIGLEDPRVDEVFAKVSRIDVSPPGTVGVAVRKQTLRNRF